MTSMEQLEPLQGLSAAIDCKSLYNWTVFNKP